MEEIVDVLDDSGPLLYMGSVLSESCEELEILMEYLSLEDDDGRVGKCSYISCSYMFLCYIRIFFWEAKMFLYFLILFHYLFYFEVVNLNYLTIDIHPENKIYR
jgi:hypothetical protein